jgi:pimeloyl-ACP methyl ester carboxylesterase
MSKDFRILYVETREKLSSRVTGRVDYGVEEMGLDLVAIVDYYSLQGKQFMMFGSSLGGTAILDCISRLDQEPLAIVLIAPNALFRVPRFGRIIILIFPPRLYLIFKPFIKWYLRTFRLDTKSDSAQYEKYSAALDAADPWKLKKAAKALKDYTVWDKLSHIKIPALVISASKDILHEPENVGKIAELLPNGSHRDLKTNTRMHEAEVVECIRDFINQ